MTHTHLQAQYNILRPTGAQLRRQYRDISPGTLVFDQDPLKIEELILADLRICEQDLLC